MALLRSTCINYTLSWLCHDSTWLYFTLLDILYYTLPCLYFPLLDSTQLYYTLPWLYFALFESTTLYHSSTWLYLTLLYTLLLLYWTLLDSTGPYYTLATMALHGST